MNVWERFKGVFNPTPYVVVRLQRGEGESSTVQTFFLRYGDEMVVTYDGNVDFVIKHYPEDQ